MLDPLELVLEAASQAGSAIMDHYDSHLPARQKDDGSPVTDADLAADQAIHEVLASSGIAIVSEEGKAAAPVPQLYWLVDPLDGTIDFWLEQDNSLSTLLWSKAVPRDLGLFSPPPSQRRHLLGAAGCRRMANSGRDSRKARRKGAISRP